MFPLKTRENESAMPLMTAIWLVVLCDAMLIYGSPTAVRRPKEGHRYSSEYYDMIVYPNTKFPIICTVEMEKGNGFGTFRFDSSDVLWSYISDTTLSTEKCRPLGPGSDKCSARWWPAGLKWVQINYTRDYRSTNRVADALILLDSITTYAVVSLSGDCTPV